MKPRVYRAVAGMLLLVGLPLPEAQVEPSSPSLSIEAPGEWEPDEGWITHGRRIELQAEIEPGQRGVFFVEQQAVDVRLEILWLDSAGSSPTLWDIDAPLDFDGVEVVLLPRAARGPVALRLDLREPGEGKAATEVRQEGAARSHLRVRFESIAERNENRSRLEFLGHLTAAGRAWATGDGEGRRRALAHYRHAAELGSPDPAESELQTQAAHAVAVLHRLLGESREALEWAEPLVEVWRQHDNRPRLADAWNEIGLSLRVAGRLEEARQAFNAGLAGARALEDPFRGAYLEGNLCLLDFMQNDLEGGVRCYSEALPRVRRIGDRETESTYLLNLARARRSLGENDLALGLYRKALEIQRAEGFEKLEAQTLNNLAGFLRERGELETAIDAYRRAAASFERLGDARWQGRSLHNLATAQLHLGDLESARQSLEGALAIHRRIDNQRGEASSLRILGHVMAVRGDWPAALSAYEDSRDLGRPSENPLGAALATLFLGRAELESQNPKAALRLLDEALAVLPEGSQPWIQATGQLLRGRALAGLGRGAEAKAALQDALDLFERLDHPKGRGQALLELAGLETPERELELLSQAALLRDSMTLHLQDADARAFFAGSWRAVHERWVARLLAAGQLERALEVSEGARAWGLRSTIGRRGEPDRGLAAARAPDLAAMRGLLDEETRLLHFLVGEEVSFLFVVGKRQLEVHALPPRSELEARIRLVLEGFREAGIPSEPTTAATLSRLLLGPAWPRLDRPDIARLALVLDGPLHYLAFAALPWPSRPDRVVAERFELVRLPSAGVLSRERQRRTGAPPGFAAVLADPVFSPADLRLELSAIPGPVSSPGEFPPEIELLPRLRSSAREVQAIQRAAGDRSLLVATGTQASRQWLLSRPLDDFAILHLATHARIDDAVAARSGLELAAVSASGERLQGFVASGELRRLRLRADLVVLSACSTALGPEIRGEGLSGLVQAFLEAGGSRVVASLWPVPDRATAELMDRFYAALATGDSPSVALRRAQLDLRATTGFEHPSRWAGFVLVGDWGDADGLR